MADNYKKQLVDYFKKNLVKGYSSDALKIALIKQDYSRTVIDKAIEQANKELAERVPLFKEKPKIKYEVLNEKDKPVIIKKSWLKRIFGL